MNMREIVVTVSIALLMTAAINYFFLAPKGTQPEGGNKSGQTFVAPQSSQEVKPLQLEVNFMGAEVQPEIVTTAIDTSYAHFIFSSAGATLQTATFKEHAKNTPTLMTTISKDEQPERNNEAFLVALSELTPYYYELKDKTENENAHELTYAVQFDRGVIEKKFSISKNIHKIDLEITITPTTSKGIEPRILLPAPFMKEIAQDESISALVVNEKGSLEKIKKAKLDAHRGWFSPRIFGSEDKYFIHALIQDPKNFIKRAYYKSECNDLIAILEGETITEKTAISVSFYLGPKSDAAIAPVDNRLEAAIEYSGIFAPLSRLLLALLVYFYTYLGNYGLAIIALTIFIKLVLLPFTLSGQKSLKKRDEYSKKLAYIQQKYKHDPEQLKIEQAELIKKHGLPGMAGCLPLLIQFPLMIALNKVLATSIELYKAPFGLWIHDLSAPDPYYILPILVAVTMFVQALWAERSQRISLLSVGLVLGAVMVSFPAGLVLYIVVNSLLQITQSAITGKAA